MVEIKGVVIEEKERYIIDRFDGDIFDTKKGYYPSNQTICEIINQQDKQIKELKKENKELEIKIDKCGTELVNAESLVSYLENENQQLKQQLHDLPKKIVEEIRDDMSKRIIEKQIKWGDNIQIGFICNAINECLDTILK